MYFLFCIPVSSSTKEVFLKAEYWLMQVFCQKSYPIVVTHTILPLLVFKAILEQVLWHLFTASFIWISMFFHLISLTFFVFGKSCYTWQLLQGNLYALPHQKECVCFQLMSAHWKETAVYTSMSVFTFINQGSILVIIHLLDNTNEWSTMQHILVLLG